MRRIAFLAISVVLGLHTASQTALSQSTADIGFEGHVFHQATNKVLPGAVVQLNQSVGATNTFLFFAVRADASGLFFAQLPVAAVDPADVVTAVNTVTITCYTRRRTYSQTVSFYNPMQFGTIYRRDYYLDVPKSVKSCL